jgi:hypothetical protein
LRDSVSSPISRHVYIVFIIKEALVRSALFEGTSGSHSDSPSLKSVRFWEIFLKNQSLTRKRLDSLNIVKVGRVVHTFMISEKRSQAARINGARSRGPVTPEGKAISSRNALRHGLLADIVVLSNEDAKTFEGVFHMLIERFSPVDDVELSAIEEMAAAHWRLRRVMSMERALLEDASLKTPDDGAAEQLAAAFSDPANQTTLLLLQRYEARFQSMYHRALRSLAVLRKLPARAPEPNEPKDTNVTPNVCNTEPPKPTPIRPPQPAEPTAEPLAEHTDPFIIQLTSPDLEFLPVNPDIFR